MNRKITREEAVKLYRDLWDVSKLSGIKFAYAIARNIKALEPIIAELKRVYTPDKEFIEYDETRAKIAKKYAFKNEKGEPKMVKVDGVDEYDISDKDAFDQEYEKLKTENAEVIEKRQSQLENYKHFMNEQIEIDFYLLREEMIPETITGEQLIKLYPILEDQDAKN